MQILNVVEFCETPAVGADEYQRVRKKPDPARLIEDKFSLINKGLILVIQECIVDALLRQNSRFVTAFCGALEPALDVFSEVFKQLLLDGWRRGRNRCGHGDRDTTSEAAFIGEECTGSIDCRNLSSGSMHLVP